MWWLLTSLEAGNWIRWVWDLPWPSEGFPDPCLGTSKMGYWSLMVSHWSFWYWSFRGILILIKMDGMRIAINDSSMTQRPSLVCNSYSSMISEDRPVFLRQLGGFRFFRRSMCRMTMPMDSAQEPTRVNMTCWFISPMFVAWSLDMPIVFKNHKGYIRRLHQTISDLQLLFISIHLNCLNLI